MNQIPKISDTEWQVMKVLWAKSPLSANEVVEQLEGKTDWKPKTVKTLLGRLVVKKALAYDKDSRAYNYYPLVSEKECVKEESRSFLKRVYNGALKAMLVNYLEEQKLSEQDIEELKRILDDNKS